MPPTLMAFRNSGCPGMSNRSLPVLVSLFTLLLTACASGPASSTPITVLRAIPFASKAEASSIVRNECLLENNLAEQLRAALTGEYTTVTVLDRITPATPGRTLTARITQVVTLVNGDTTLTVDGVLRENGRVIGSFTARQARPATRPGASTSQCGSLLQISRVLGREIAAWSRQPSMNAQLASKTP